MVACCRQGAAGIASAFAVLGAACLPDPVFVCETHEQCSALGETARCEGVRFCSDVDQNCTSGRRFHDYAGDGLAGLCTDVTCGDGDVVGDEECDDGNDIDGDGCNNDCRVSGQEVWAVSYASPGDVRDRCYSVAADSRGNVTVVGHISTVVDIDGVPTEQADIWVRQYDGDGEDVWTWVLDRADNVSEEGWSVAVLENDDILVAASVGTDPGRTDAWTGRLGSDGILQWEAQHDGEAAWLDAARDAVAAPDGDVVAIGYATTVDDRESDLWFQRRSPDGRTIRWTAHRDGFPDMVGQWAQDRGHGIARVPGGYVGVGVRQAQGAVMGEYHQHHFVEHFDEQGNQVWSDLGLAGEPDSVWTAVAATPEGEVLLAGWIAATVGGDSDMWLQRRDPGGAILWEETIASPGGDNDRANAIVVDERGGFIVGGEMGAGAGSTDAWIRRYTPEGTDVWTWTLSGPAGDRDTTWGLDIADDGTVYACGYQSTPGSEWDLWVRRFTP
jgi:cysteine-rich repeat protein